MTADDSFVSHSDTGGHGARRMSPLEQRLSRIIYGYDRGILRASRCFDATPAESLAAVSRVFPNAPYDLRLIDCMDGSAVEGGALVFKVLSWSDALLGERFWFRFRLKAVFIDHVWLRLSSCHTARDSVELQLTADLKNEVRIGTRWYLLPLVLAGSAGGAFGFSWLADRLWGLDEGALLTIWLVGALVGGFAGAATLARWGRGAIAKARMQLDGLLAATEESLRQRREDPASAA